MHVYQAHAFRAELCRAAILWADHADIYNSRTFPYAYGHSSNMFARLNLIVLQMYQTKYKDQYICLLVAAGPSTKQINIASIYRSLLKRGRPNSATKYIFVCST